MPQAPHLVVSVFMRGLLRRLMTRIYFPGEAANEADAVLASVPPQRRHTLIANAMRRTRKHCNGMYTCRATKKRCFLSIDAWSCSVT